MRRRPHKKGSILRRSGNLCVSYPFHKRGHRLDRSSHAYPQTSALRVVCLQLEASVEPAAHIACVNLDSDYSSLTRLYDFLEIKVFGLASGRDRPKRSDDRHLTIARSRA